MPTFGERLQQLRENARLTQQQLALASGVNVWTIRGYEQGRREPNWKGIIQLAAVLGVPVEAFADCRSKDEAESAAEQPPRRTAKDKPNQPTARRRPRKGSS